MLSFSIRRHRTLVGVLSLAMFLILGLAMGTTWAAAKEQVEALGVTMSPELMAIFGARDFSTPAGFYEAKTLGLMAPIAVIAAGIVAAVALARDECDGVLGLVFGTPVSRSRVLAGSIFDVLMSVTVVSAATALGIWTGSVVGGFTFPVTRIIDTFVVLSGLGLAFSGTALLVAGATGIPGLGVWSSIGAALFAHFGNALGAFVAGGEFWVWLSPFNWYGAVNPLIQTPELWRILALFLLGAVTTALAFPLFRYRDLR